MIVSHGLNGLGLNTAILELAINIVKVIIDSLKVLFLTIHLHVHAHIFSFKILINFQKLTNHSKLIIFFVDLSIFNCRNHCVC